MSKPTVTLVMPVSRLDYLDRVFNSIKNQTVQPDKFLIITGSEVNEEQVKKYTYGDTKFIKVMNEPSAKIMQRRINISNIHNAAREYIDTDLVFSVEDDGVLPNDALEKLLESSHIAGIVTGYELGRWSAPYIGVWTVDDVKNPRVVTSLTRGQGVRYIDAMGLYCALIRSDIYKSHHFTSDNGLGPDVNLGIYSRLTHNLNIVNWDVPVTHLTTRDGVNIEIPADSGSITVRLEKQGHTWRLT